MVTPKKPLEVQITAVTTRLEALLEAIGGTTPEQREKGIEVLKGITSRAVVSIVAAQLEGTARSLESATQVVKALKTNARELEGG